MKYLRIGPAVVDFVEHFAVATLQDLLAACDWVSLYRPVRRYSDLADQRSAVAEPLARLAEDFGFDRRPVAGDGSSYCDFVVAGDLAGLGAEVRPYWAY